jgi:hypothetical protein
MSLRLPGVVPSASQDSIPTMGMDGSCWGITPRPSEDYDAEMHGSWRDNVIRVRPSDDFDLSILHGDVGVPIPITDKWKPGADQFYGSMRMN